MVKSRKTASQCTVTTTFSAAGSAKKMTDKVHYDARQVVGLRFGLFGLSDRADLPNLRTNSAREPHRHCD